MPTKLTRTKSANQVVKLKRVQSAHGKPKLIGRTHKGYLLKGVVNNPGGRRSLKAAAIAKVVNRKDDLIKYYKDIVRKANAGNKTAQRQLWEIRKPQLMKTFVELDDVSKDLTGNYNEAVEDLYKALAVGGISVEDVPAFGKILALLKPKSDFTPSQEMKILILPPSINNDEIESRAEQVRIYQNKLKQKYLPEPIVEAEVIEHKSLSAKAGYATN